MMILKRSARASIVVYLCFVAHGARLGAQTSSEDGVLPACDTPATIDREYDVINGYTLTWEDMELFESVIQLDNDAAAVAVGPRALVTAAHNLYEDATIRVKDGDLVADCDRIVDPPGFPDPDFALCVTREPIGHLLYDRIYLGKDEIASYSTVTLSGFGCIRAQGEAGLLNIKPNVSIRKWPDTDPNLVFDGCFCYGDSGGPAFAEIDDRRQVVAINSRGICRSGLVMGSCRTKIEQCARATSTSSLAEFIEGWAEGDRFRGAVTRRVGRVAVCGVNKSDGCR